jgi:putative ATP-dependent endonuclease of the OLD family
VRSLLRSLDLTGDLGAIMSALQQFGAALDDADALSQFRTELAEALNTALPAEVTRNDIRLITSGEVDDDPLGGVSLGVDHHGQVAPLQEQSDGLKSLMLMAALGLAHRGANVVAVDEPERHLHPLASRSIARLLSGGLGQRIIATHSSAIASAMPSLDLVALSPDRAPRQLPSGAPASATAFVLRWWNPLLIEPLTARKIICVEGPADLQMVRGCARALEINLDKMGISLFDLGGANNFRTAYELFGPPGFGVQLLGLVDLDHAVEWATVLGVAPADLVQHGVFVADPDLEAAYTVGLGPGRTLDLLVSSQLFNEANLLQATGAATRATVTSAALATALRDSKVKAGGVVGAGLNRDDALLIHPIVDLLGTVQ